MALIKKTNRSNLRLSAQSYFYALKTAWHIKPSYIVSNYLLCLTQIPSKLMNIWIVECVINSALANQPFISIVEALLIYFIYQVIVYGLRSHINFRFNPIAEEEIRTHIQEQLHERAINANFELFDNPEFYNTYSQALSRQAELTTKCISQSAKILDKVISSLTLAGALVYTSPVIIVILAICSLADININSLRTRIVTEKSRLLIPLRRRIEYINDIFYKKINAENLKAGFINKIASEDFRAQSENIIAIIRKLNKKIAYLRQANYALDDISIIFVWGWLGYLLLNKEIDAGIFMAMTNAALLLQSAIGSITSASPDFGESCIMLQQALEFESYPLETDKNKNTTNAPTEITKITFDNVSFAYPRFDLNDHNASNTQTAKASERTLSNVSFEVKQGNTLALVGHNGAGKSTILKLLSRFYDACEGTIYINDTPINAIDPYQLRKSIAYVFQYPILYEYSIAENILGRQCTNTSDESTVKRSLEQVGLLEEINKLPKGIHTFVGKEFDASGFQPSGGQLQRLAIARALARDYAIIVMDEPSSALDPIAEAQIATLLDTAFQDRICIVVSHRLNVIKNAHIIAVLDNGTISELGTHAELLANDKTYCMLYNASNVARDA